MSGIVVVDFQWYGEKRGRDFDLLAQVSPILVWNTPVVIISDKSRPQSNRQKNR